MKKCCHCRVAKDEVEFNKNVSKGNGLQAYCKPCHTEINHAYYKKNPNRHIYNNRLKREENRLKMMKYLDVHPCVDCGEMDILVLEFDHQRDKTNTITVMVNKPCGWGTIMKEIDKCVVRCANCHRRKTALERGWYKTQRTQPPISLTS